MAREKSAYGRGKAQVEEKGLFDSMTGGIFNPDPQKKVARLERRAARGNMRAMQKLQAMEAYKKSKEDPKKEILSPADLQAAATVSEDVGGAAAQSLLQGQMPGQVYAPGTIKAGMEAGQDIAAGSQKNILDRILAWKRGELSDQRGLVSQGGESQWKQDLATAELGIKTASGAASYV